MAIFLSGSLIISGSTSITQGISASLQGTSSFAISASWAPSIELPIEAGAVVSSSFGGDPLTASVTIPTPFPSTNYSITVTGEDVRYWTVQNKTTSSFIINSNTGSALLGSTYWIATQY